MKYTCLFKSLDELNVGDFDDEVLEPYGTLSVLEVSNDVTDAIVSYKRESDGEEVVTTIGELKKEWREKQMELVLGDLSERVADKVVEKLEEKKQQQLSDEIAMLMLNRQPTRIECDALPEKGDSGKMYCLNGQEWIWYNDDWVQIG